MSGFGAKRFVIGLAVALIVVLAIGEWLARFASPQDIAEYVDRGRAGPYKSDPLLGVDYRSFAAFRDENAARIATFSPLDRQRPAWLWLGSSFVQAKGMLGETAQARFPDIRMVYLGRNEFLPLRVAQIGQFTAGGLRPERIVFALLPHDQIAIGQRPLDFVDVTPSGAIASRMRSPPWPLDRVVSSSRLATIAWIRSGLAVGDRNFRASRVTAMPSPRMRDDLRRLLRVLAERSRDAGATATVVTIPNREQVFGTAAFGFQDAIDVLCRELGLDHYDASRAFDGESDKRGLFIPDWHFNDKGNRLLLDGLLAHWGMRPVARANAAR